MMTTRLDLLSSTWMYSPFCQIEGDGGTDGGAGGGGTVGVGDGTSGDGSPGGAGTGGGASGPDWDSFIRGMDNLNANLGGKFDALLTEVKSSRPAPAPDPEPEPGDIDAMSNSELSSHIVSRVMKAFEGLLGEKLAPVTSQVNNLTTSFTTDNVTRQINTLRADAKDFNDWNSEMLDLAKEHPSLGVKDLYHLAKSRNPAKSEELAKKYAPPPKPKPNAFGGFGPAPNGKGGQSPVVSALEAARSAYAEVSERHPGVLPPLSE
jgi:hypothetical protein